MSGMFDVETIGDNIWLLKICTFDCEFFGLALLLINP
jgi:hypothetical protein